jgi:hypothetical protein
MNNTVLQAFVKSTSSRRAALRSSVRRFVMNDQFCNLVENIDVNDNDIRRKMMPGNPYFICGQLTAFNGIPGITEQIASWLRAN